MNILLTVLVLLLFPVTSEATYYWAATTGTNNRVCTQMDSVDSATDPGSYGTINRAAVCATSPGDVIIIKAGTYTGTNNRINTVLDCTGTCLASGTSESVRTIIMADPAAGTTPVISVANWYASYMTNPRNYITIKNLKIDVSNGAGSLESDGGGATITLGGHHILVENVEIINSYNMAIFTYYGATTNNIIIRNNSLHGYGIDGNGYGVYVQADNVTLEYNEAYSAKGAGFQIFSDTAGVTPINATVRGNYVHDIAKSTQSGALNLCAGLYIEGSGHVVSRNIFNGSGCTSGAVGEGIVSGYNSGDKLTAYNNIVVNWRSNGIRIGAFTSTTGNIIKNNIVIGNVGQVVATTGSTTSTTEYNACAAADACGTTGKLTITALTDCTPGASTYTQKAGSSCIDAGVAITGFNYNGSAPDIGPFESFTFATCSVEDGDASNMRVTFNNNVFPPVLPASNADTGGFTTRKAGAANTVTATTRVGDNRVDLTLTNAIVNGNAIDVTYTSGGQGDLTDSANIGGSSWAALKQGYVQTLTQQACTNNVGAAASHLFIQAKFEFHGLRGTEAAPVILPYSAAAENTNINVVVGGKARLRLALTCSTADCPAAGFYLYYSKDSGAYAVVPDSFSTDNISFCGDTPDPDIPASGAVTTDQLSTAGTFVAGGLVRTSNAIPTIDLAQNNKTEIEYCLAWDTDATADATYDFRIRKQDGTVIDTYTVTPRATVRAMSAGLGF